jgi:deoxycytidylate deaminase
MSNRVFGLDKYLHVQICQSSRYTRSLAAERNALLQCVVRELRKAITKSLQQYTYYNTEEHYALRRDFVQSGRSSQTIIR